jgi:outer membrane protein OmpA-like peptidoglycan-associated protein
MADITLAEFNGRVWLVSGEAHLNDLLANTLAKEVSVELVACEHKTDVHDLWVQHCGKKDFVGEPWMIHPAIVARIRRSAPEYAVFFGQWSAMLDAAALAVIASAAAWAMENPEAPVQVTEYLDPQGPQAMADLARLRAGLIEDKLAEGGVTRTRIERVRRAVDEVPGMTQESQRVDIVVRAT